MNWFLLIVMIVCCLMLGGAVGYAVGHYGYEELTRCLALITESLARADKKAKELEKENEMHWRKQMPLPLDRQVIDEEYGLEAYFCPLCGERIMMPDKYNYCRECGQAIFKEGDKNEEKR